MNSDTFYLLITNNGKTVPLFKFILADSQTISTLPIFKDIQLPILHTTLHQPDTIQPTTVIHLRETVGTTNTTLMRDSISSKNPSLIEIGSVMIDLHIDWDTIKPFQKTSFTDSFILNTQNFGIYLTAYCFQGKKEEIEKKFDNLLKNKKVHMIIPYPDGFGTPPGGQIIKHVGCIFEGTKAVTIGVLLLGCSDVDSEKLKSPKSWSFGKMKYAAFAPKKRKIDETT